jgi:hypothetical protein
MDYNKLALEEAQKSPCKKRKVGAVIVNKDKTKVLAKGHNFHLYSEPCEDSQSNTDSLVIHAEIAVINKTTNLDEAKYIYVTHPPCNNCQEAIDEAGLEVILVDDFIKFDSGKLRYGLVPPKAMKELAKVLTYGAKKYKPNNWQKAKDTNRYIDALYRHLEAWRSGEKVDEGSGLSHLSHAMSNIVFLIHFEDIKD